VPNFKVATLNKAVERFVEGKQGILKAWVTYPLPESVLDHHEIDKEFFVDNYAGNVFDYFIAVVKGEQAMGDCPVMAQFLNFLKDRDVSSDELYVICSHFRKSMIDFIYDSAIDSRAMIDEVSGLFDRNFTGVLKMYSERLYEKDQELQQSIKLLNEYKRAIDESALVSKTDLEGNIIYVNDNLVEASGYRDDELIGQSHNVMRHPDMEEAFFKEMWETIQHKKVFKGTIKNLRKNGDYFFVDATILPITDAQENVSEYIAISYEVTKLIDARQEALEAGHAKEYFLSNMSHEIRTPLNAVLGFVSILQTEDPTSKQKKYLDIVQKSGESLLNIINDILDFSKLRSGEFTIEPRQFVLHEELSQTLELFAAPANEKEITLLSFIDPAIPYRMVSDPLRMKQIIANFLSNAIKFTPYGGKVEVEVTCPESGQLKITVKDNGIGIAVDDQVNIFKAFAQTQNSSTYMYGGTGLGLSICMQLAKHMGGDISLESEPDTGSRFSLHLPVEAMEESCSVEMFDSIDFNTIRVAFLENQGKSTEKEELLERYWGVFGLDVERVSSVEDLSCDILFFIDTEIDEFTRQELIASKTPAIAIMDYLSETYDEVPHIASLYFPIYCAKIYNAFLEATQQKSDVKGATAPARGQRQFNARVLVAEDNSANQELIKIILNRYGIAYVIASDGREALSTFKEETFDLVLMDEQMPRMNGIEATQKIIAYEQENGLEHTPIVALTANVIKGVKEHSLAAGYDAFLGKPVVIKELEAVFEQFLEEGENIALPTVEKEGVGNQLIHGIDEEKVLKELMLDPEQLLMLMEVFLNKMARTMPELKAAIDQKSFEETARLAHSVKGSSANFRIKHIQKLAKEMEAAAMASDGSYDYEGEYQTLKRALDGIYIIK
jgi:PAS domain S-box-containing protein